MHINRFKVSGLCYKFCRTSPTKIASFTGLTGMGYKEALLQPALLAILITSSHISQEWLCVTGEHNCEDQTWPF